MKEINFSLRWTILIAAILLPASFSELKHGFGQENETAQNEDESNKFVDYLQNARDLLNQTSVEFNNSNYTGAEELANTAYLDNFEHVEHEVFSEAIHDSNPKYDHCVSDSLRVGVFDGVKCRK